MNTLLLGAPTLKQLCEICVRDSIALISVFVRQKVTFNENLSFTYYAPRIQLPDGSKLAINRKSDHDVTIFRHDVIVKVFDVVLFFLSGLVTGPSFKSIL